MTTLAGSLINYWGQQFFLRLRLAYQLAVLIERFASELLLRLLDKFVLQHLLCGHWLRLVHLLGTFVDNSPRAELLFRRTMARHGALIIEIIALVDLVEDAHYVALGSTLLLMLLLT